MPDKSQQLMIDALTVAMAEPAGCALHGAKSQRALFATSVPAKRAAERCKELGYLQTVRTESAGKKNVEICQISEKGIAFLLNELNPKQVMEAFTRTVEERGQEVGRLIQAAQDCQTTLLALKNQVEKVLVKVQPTPAPVAAPSANGCGPWKTHALGYLSQFQQSKPSEDCPLPELYRQAQQTVPSLTTIVRPRPGHSAPVDGAAL
jgi:hypothetical protein